jgi:hypothetical protein
MVDKLTWLQQIYWTNDWSNTWCIFHKQKGVYVSGKNKFDNTDNWFWFLSIQPFLPSFLLIQLFPKVDYNRDKSSILYQDNDGKIGQESFFQDDEISCDNIHS